MSLGEIVGQVLDGKYSIERHLGKGGMGTVYLATHIGTGRPVAVKVIAPDFMRKTEFVERFRREARAAGKLRHPNVVDVTDFGFCGTEDGDEVAYLVMEYLDGCTLGEILDEEGQLPVDWSIDIIEQICSAVEEAHRQGVIHRDLKPDNIWLEPNQRGGYTVKVLDFGIAKLEEGQDFPGSGSENDISGAGTGESKGTIADEGGTETVVDDRSPTMLAEGDTVAISDESGTLILPDTDGGTVVGSEGDSGSFGDPEDGTVLLPSTTKGSSQEDVRRDTVSYSRSPDTDRSLLDSPSTSALTRVGAVLGTPLYMSPEQCRGEKLTPRSDIYSLAVIIYQMLSGNLPFEGDFVTVMDGHKNQEPPPFSAKKVPKKMRGTIMQSLAKDPADRPVSAEAFANKLRANSEGLGSLLTRSVVIYGGRLPKFLLLATITFIPLIILTFARVGVNFLRAMKLIETDLSFEIISGFLTVSGFFVQIVSGAMLVGMTTWVVAQILAYPLRPLNLWAAFREARSKVKSLSGTVILSVLIAMVGLLFCLLPGIWLSARYMLIAPSIMMEGVKGRAAFKRSIELTKRSFRTVFAIALLVYVVPSVLAVGMALSIGSIIGNIEKANQLSEIRRTGVVPVKEEKKKDGVNFKLNGRNFEINSETDGMANRFSVALQEGLFELLWTPLAVLISSFTSVISALIYFKTRQAGGESMQGLLSKINSANCPKSHWQMRVQERLIQSGKTTGDGGNSL